MRYRYLLVVGFLAFLLACAFGESDSVNVIVKLKKGQSIRQLNSNYGTRTIKKVAGRDIYLVQANDNKTLKKIGKDDGVDVAEADGRFRLTSAPLSGAMDADLVQDMVSMLDGQTTTTFNGSTVLKAYAQQSAVSLIHLDAARTISTGAGTRIGYIDTGVDPNHPALKAWLDPGVDVISNRSASEFDGLSQDMVSMLDQDMVSMLDPEMVFMLDHDSSIPKYFGHGTMVAGLIHLVAPNARIVPIKAFDPYGYTTLFSVIQGIYAAIDADVDVLNLSFSTSQDSDVLHSAIDEAKTAGIAVVASAGNDAHDVRGLYPASYSTVFGVASTDLTDHLASFSNYGRSVAVSAPGAFVISTFPGGRYAAVWGTSFSAPIVSGSIGLVASLRGHGQSNSRMVVDFADSIDALNPGFEKMLGKGRVNVFRALKN